MARKVKPETRAKRMADSAPASKQAEAYQLALNIIFMEDKLDQARDLIASTSVAIQYNNGGGQAGIRENPAYKGYHQLLKSYIAALNAFEGLTEATADKQSKSALAEHRRNFKVIRSA